MSGLDPKKFAELMERVYEQIPMSGSKSIERIVKSFIKNGTGYGASDAKAAILGLKADGRIILDNKGFASRNSNLYIWLKEQFPNAKITTDKYNTI